MGKVKGSIPFLFVSFVPFVFFVVKNKHPDLNGIGERIAPCPEIHLASSSA